MFNITYSVSNKKSQLSMLVLLAFFTLAVFGLSQLYGGGTGPACSSRSSKFYKRQRLLAIG